jgi:hypothetical protein
MEKFQQDEYDQKLGWILSQRSLRSPSPQVWQAIFAQISSPYSRVNPASNVAWLRIGSGLVGFMIVLVLWLTVQPGVVLQWSVAGNPPTTFRIYRALAGAEDYRLIHEIEAPVGTAEYQFIDTRLIPGRWYSYRIEGIYKGGNVSISESVNSPVMGALPAQLTIFIIGTILAYTTYLLFAEADISRQASFLKT